MQAFQEDAIGAVSLVRLLGGFDVVAGEDRTFSVNRTKAPISPSGSARQKASAGDTLPGRRGGGRSGSAGERRFGGHAGLCLRDAGPVPAG